jgi:hypothetical protein
MNLHKEPFNFPESICLHFTTHEAYFIAADIFKNFNEMVQGPSAHLQQHATSTVVLIDRLISSGSVYMNMDPRGYTYDKNLDDPAISSGVKHFFVFSVLAPWWPNQESDWTEIWSVTLT